MIYKLRELNTDEALRIVLDLDKIEVNEPFTFDANLKWVRPFGMLLIAIAIKQFRRKHASENFRIETNPSLTCTSYAGHMGFFKCISKSLDIGKMPGEAIGNSHYIPITEIDFQQLYQQEIDFGNSTLMGDVIEKESHRLSTILSRDNLEVNKILSYSIREILRNIVEHSESKNAWICGQYWNNETAEIAIIDEGIGIKSSLQRNRVHRKYIDNDQDALIYAVKAGISQAFDPSKKNPSSEVWSNSGFGLYMVSEICKELKGSFCLVTNSKYLYIDDHGETLIGDSSFQGTAVKITICTSMLFDCQSMLNRISKRGEEQAKKTRNAFKNASLPSKGLLTK